MKDSRRYLAAVQGALMVGGVTLRVITAQQGLKDTDTFAALKLSNDEVQQIVAGAEHVAFDTPDSWSRELRARRVDLGSGAGIVLRGTQLLCGGTGNCQIFVFRRVHGKWVSLFDQEAPVGESFDLGPATSKGIKDMVITANSSAETAQRVTYRFDGMFYRAEGPRR